MGNITLCPKKTKKFALHSERAKFLYNSSICHRPPFWKLNLSKDMVKKIYTFPHNFLKITITYKLGSVGKLI